LDEHVVLAKQEGHSAVLVKRLHVFTSRRGRGRPLVHAAAGVALLDLNTDTAYITSDNTRGQQVLIFAESITAGQSPVRHSASRAFSFPLEIREI